ncbi:hypothetical protein BpHYR1_044442 [Brachionus plicatilis]|uniref:Uncharacterized protein n=1 Tax=Brachionus plicatilis TaxID=10195 RepID=A0A3M7QST1_BRAPC|nr:hypothetical protein BpHYR1_044442 [Brachionus plicatilis]
MTSMLLLYNLSYITLEVFIEGIFLFYPCFFHSEYMLKLSQSINLNALTQWLRFVLEYRSALENVSRQRIPRTNSAKFISCLMKKKNSRLGLDLRLFNHELQLKLKRGILEKK